jgi:hypothetical protein
VDDVAVVDQRERVGEHGRVFGREAGDQVRADRDVGTGGLQAFDQRDAFGARMAALHALQDHVVAGLEREVDVRHDARLAREQREQAVVDLDAVERG